MSERTRRGRGRSASGFTLLEVLAAVAVLGLTVAMLARGAIQGLRYEGEAARRLAASLIADRALFEVESTLALGALPEVGRLEREEGDGDFRLVVEVAPLDPAALGLAGLFSGPPSAPNVPPPAPPPEAPTLLLVSVGVAWTEGLVEQTVTRTTFAYDASAAAQALETSGAAAGETPLEGEAPEQEPP